MSKSKKAETQNGGGSGARKSWGRDALWWVILVLIFFGVFFGMQRVLAPSPAERAATGEGTQLAPADAEGEPIRTPELNTAITEMLDLFVDEPPADPPMFTVVHAWPEEEGPVFAELRSNGLRLGKGWADAGSWDASITQAILAAEADAEAAGRAGPVTAIVLALTHDWFPLSETRYGKLTNDMRGVFALELDYDGNIVRHSPTESVSQNRGLERYQELHQKELGVSEQLYELGGLVRLAPAYQFLLTEQDGGAFSVEPMFRGNQFVPMTAVTQANVQELANQLESWMWTNLHENGRMTYLWWPSPMEEPSGYNNMIRQFMASVCLGRSAQRAGDDALLERQAENIAYNFENFYHEEEDFGLIEHERGIKLGAVGLALQALLERPDRERYADWQNALLRTTFYLTNADGSMHTFYPKDSPRQGANQNFYPGECLLAWATLYELEPDDALRERYMRVFEYYRTWHRRNRNPAFIPWHTQAHFIMWKATRETELATFIFEMNDWLVDTMSQWEGVAYDDMRGRFYAGGGRYGPPHSSSTGVYLEGLIDAFELARTVEDTQRMQVYRQAICRGLRSVMQLVFADDVDMFYVGDHYRERTLGAVRETVYDNVVRVDNVQHNLMGIYKILDTFSEEDFLLGSGQPLETAK